VNPVTSAGSWAGRTVVGVGTVFVGGERAEVLLQDLQLRLAELGTGFDAELVGEPAPDVREQPQCRGLLTGTGQCKHQPGVRGLVKWVVGCQPAHL
jgi:hypothetical protein